MQQNNVIRLLVICAMLAALFGCYVIITSIGVAFGQDDPPISGIHCDSWTGDAADCFHINLPIVASNTLHFEDFPTIEDSSAEAAYRIYIPDAMLDAEEGGSGITPPILDPASGVVVQ